MTQTPDTSAEVPELLLNLSSWIERRKDSIGPYADHIIHSVTHYEREIERLRAELAEAREETTRLKAIINTPETNDFIKGVAIEAEHQRLRWPDDHDDSKNGFDWFWVTGFLSQKAATAFEQKDADKTLHHCISTAALMMNMHRHAVRKFKGDQS